MGGWDGSALGGQRQWDGQAAGPGALGGWAGDWRAGWGWPAVADHHPPPSRALSKVAPSRCPQPMPTGAYFLSFFPAAGSKVEHPGTFLGVLERLDHIRAVGANTLLLTPCYATAQGERAAGQAGWWPATRTEGREFCCLHSRGHEVCVAWR